MLFKSVLQAGLLALVALVVLGSLGQWLAGAATLLGVAFGAGNTMLAQLTAVRIARSGDGSVARRPFIFGSLARLGVITAVSVGLVVVARPIGFGLLGGLVVYQVIMVVSSAKALKKSLAN
jgi:hypothetical protein